MNSGNESESTAATDIDALYMERQRYYKIKIRKQFLFMKKALELIAPEASLASLYELAISSLEDPMLRRFHTYFNLIIQDRCNENELLRIGGPDDVGNSGVEDARLEDLEILADGNYGLEHGHEHVSRGTGRLGDPIDLTGE